MTLREDYNRDGCVVFYGGIKERIDSVLMEAELKSAYDKGKDFYVRFLTAYAKGIDIQKMLLNPKVNLQLHRLGINDPLLISQPVLHVMSSGLRIPNGYYGTGAHQDWPSTQGSLDSATVWIALTDAGVGNFPLEVIPGSHKRGLLDGKMNGSVLEVEVDEKEFVPIECNVGDVIFMSGFTVHRTGKGTGFRVAVSQRFDNAAEATFIERGYPCAQKRVVDREVKWKPTVEQVQEIFNG